MSVDSENTCLWAYAIVITRVSPAVQTLLTLCAPSKAIQGHGNPKKKSPCSWKILRLTQKNLCTGRGEISLHSENTCLWAYAMVITRVSPVI